MAMELVDSMNGDEIDAILEEMGTSLEAAREGLVVPDDDLDAEEWKEQLRAADDRKMSLEQYLNEANDRLGDLAVPLLTLVLLILSRLLTLFLLL
ncbi:unnamed protein product, partial [Prorocentrum cordatum]